MWINERIAKFRSQIMEIAAIGVLLVHSRKFDHEPDPGNLPGRRKTVRTDSR